MGLESISLEYEGIGIRIKAEMFGGKGAIPLYHVPMTLQFPSGHIEKSGNGFDTDKCVFIGQLVEDYIMKQYYPEEFAKSEVDKDAWDIKWEEYRLDASEIFATIGRLGYIPIKDKDTN